MLIKNGIVKQMSINKSIDILYLQDTEVSKNFDPNLVSFMGYFLNEVISVGFMVGIYIKSSIKYIRRNSHVVIVNVVDNNTGKSRIIIMLQRNFKQHNNVIPRNFFSINFQLIKEAYKESI
jgi:hypothetical protein